MGGKEEKEWGARGKGVGEQGEMRGGGARGKKVRNKEKGMGSEGGGEGGGGAKAFLPENISLHEGCFV